MSRAAITPGQRVVLYGRVSKLGPGETARSVDSQLAAGRDWAQRNSLTIVAEHRDDGISAYSQTSDRPAWRQVMADIALGNLDVLWCWEVSRASRDREVSAKLLRACQDGGVLLAVNDRVHDVNDPDDGFMFDLTAALAVRESAMTQARILRTVADRARSGQPHGKIPYGYRREYDPDTGALLRQVLDEETAPVVAELARRALGGWTLYRLAHDLNTRGIPAPEVLRRRRRTSAGTDLLPGAVWTPEQVRQILLSPTVAGMRLHRGQVVAEATWPAIIAPGEHQTLHRVLADPARRTWRDGATKHLLSGIAECGVCGAPCRRVTNRGYPSYACHGHDRRGASCVIRRQKPVDLLVTETLLAFLARPDVGALLTPRDAAGEVALAAREVAELRARLDTFIASAATGGISAESLADLEGRLRPQIADAQRRAAPPDLPPQVARLICPDPHTVWYGTRPDGEDGMSVPERRQVVRHLARVVIFPTSTGHGARGFDPASVQVEVPRSG